MTKFNQVAVASRSFSAHPQLRAEMLTAHPNCRFNDAGTSLDGDRLIEFLTGCDAAITALERIDKDSLRALPDLKVISKYGVGIDMLDLKTLNQRGIRLGWSGGVNKRSVAELVIAFAISMLRHLPKAHAAVLSGHWQQIKGMELTGKTVGIVGCGRVGKDLVPLLRAFDCKVLAHDIREYSVFYQAHSVTAVTLDELLGASDIVTLHLPFDSTTENIISETRLKKMKPSAILINAARGGLVNEAALKTMLQKEKLSGAAFDVFASEPPCDLELLALPNFFATPHIGGSSEEAILAMGRAAIHGLSVNAVPDINGFFQNAPDESEIQS